MKFFLQNIEPVDEPNLAFPVANAPSLVGVQVARRRVQLRDFIFEVGSELCMRQSTVGGIKLKMTGWIGLKLTDKELTYLGDKAVPL